MSEDRIPTLWRYGDAGDAFPCKRGDVWRAGDHRVSVGNLELGDGQRLLTRFGSPDHVYSDPPWTAGNARSFRTKAGQPRKVDFGMFLSSFLDVVKQAREHVFIEMGFQELERLSDMIVSSGGRVLQSMKITYYRKHPCWLVHATWNPTVQPLHDYPTNYDDEETPSFVMGRVMHKGDTVLDPCLGRGLTLREGHTYQMKVIGMELHPRRLAVGLQWLSECGIDPVKMTPMEL